MLRIVIALGLLALGMMRTIKWMWLIKNQGFAHETTLPRRYWNTGQRGMRWFLVLELLAGIGFVISGVALLAGWADVAVRLFVGAASLSLLVSILWLPIFWGLMIVMIAFVLTITLGAMWLEPQVAIWFSR